MLVASRFMSARAPALLCYSFSAEKGTCVTYRRGSLHLSRINASRAQRPKLLWVLEAQERKLWERRAKDVLLEGVGANRRRWKKVSSARLFRVAARA